MKGDHAMFKRAVHPGLILKDELDELGVSLTEFARQIDVPANRISQIIAGKRSITGDTALRFGHWFTIEPQFWLNLQAQYDLAIADRQTGDAIRHLPTRSNLPARPEQPRLV
jgi:addiction module HigA family antidote